MANNKKISQLGLASGLTGTELVPVVQGGVTKQTTTQEIADLDGTTPTLQEVITENPTVDGVVFESLDGLTKVEISDGLLKITCDGFVDFVTNNLTKNGVGIETQDNKSSSFTASSTTTYPNTKALVDGLNGKQGIIYKDLITGSNVTGTTAITLAKISSLIPANTFKVGDVVIIKTRCLRDTATGTFGSFIYINSTPDLIGATLLGTFTAAARLLAQERGLDIKSSTATETLLASVNSATSELVSSGNTPSVLNIDWTQTWYIISAVQNAAIGNTAQCSSLKIYKE